MTCTQGGAKTLTDHHGGLLLAFLDSCRSKKTLTREYLGKMFSTPTFVFFPLLPVQLPSALSKAVFNGVTHSWRVVGTRAIRGSSVCCVT